MSRCGDSGPAGVRPASSSAPAAVGQKPALFLAVLLALLSGCSALLGLLPGDDVEKVGQAEAVDLVWTAYGGSGAPPTVLWVDRLDCDLGYAGRRGFVVLGHCADGITILPSHISCAWNPGDDLAHTALAHEMFHAAQMRRGVLDPGHSGPEWKAGGIVPRTERALREAGL